MVLSSAGNHMLWVPNQRLVRKSPLVLPARNPSSVFEEEHNDDVDYTDVSFGMWVGHIPSHLHPTCTLPRHLLPSHPYHPSLSRGKDLDPTSRWVLALLRESARSLCPHRCLPTFIPPIQPHSTRPLCCPPSSKLRLFPPQPSKNHPPLFHGSLGLHRRQLSVPT